MVVLYIAIIMVMRVVQSYYSKQASNLIASSKTPYAKYVTMSMTFSSFFSALIFVIMHDFSGLNAETVIISSLSGISLAMCSLLSLRSYHYGTVVLNSVFSTAGLIIPCVAGVFVFNEPMSFIQVASIAVLLFSAYLLIGSSKEIYGTFTLKGFLLLIGTFFANGMTMFFQKLFAHRVPDGNVSLFSFFTFFVPAVLLAIMTFIKKPQNEDSTEKKTFPKKLVFFAATLAFAVFVVNQLATISASLISSAILFTFINGGATIIAAIVGAIVFKERLSVKSVIGIILGVASLICISSF